MVEHSSVSKAAVDYVPEKVGILDLAEAVGDIGYKVAMDNLSFKVMGMSCAACVSKVEKVIM